jgi:lysophospholipase L1-like esterase
MRNILKEKRNILFLGASITEGRISKSYVRILKSRLGTTNFRFINQGVAGFESYNVWKKLDKAIGTGPDYVIILVGTNDVLSSLDPALGKLTRKLKHIPHEPTLLHYQENITAIVQALKKGTNARISMASLPVVGEDLGSRENRSIEEYNAALKQIANREEVTYLPVFEKQKEFLMQAIGGKGRGYGRNSRLAYKALFQHFILFMDLDRISRRNGYLLLTDGIHQNSKGAGFIAAEVEAFIQKSKNHFRTSKLRKDQ